MLSFQTQHRRPQWRCGERGTRLRDSGFLVVSVPQAVAHRGRGELRSSRIYDEAVYLPKLCLPAASLENCLTAFMDTGSPQRTASGRVILRLPHLETAVVVQESRVRSS